MRYRAICKVHPNVVSVNVETDARDKDDKSAVEAKRASVKAKYPKPD